MQQMFINLNMLTNINIDLFDHSQNLINSLFKVSSLNKSDRLLNMLPCTFIKWSIQDVSSW